MTYETYYASITKPFFAPEPWVFGLAWGIIYPLIAIAAFYALYLAVKGRLSLKLIGVFLVNMLANFAFTPLQLNYPEAPWASLDILVVLGTLVYLQCAFWRQSKAIFYLLLPYLLWGSFATMLQLTIFIHKSIV